MAVCGTSSYEECASKCLCKEVVEDELKAKPKPATPLSWIQPLPDLPHTA